MQMYWIQICHYNDMTERKAKLCFVCILNVYQQLWDIIREGICYCGSMSTELRQNLSLSLSQTISTHFSQLQRE